MNVDPVVAARAGFTPQEIELDASAILQGEPATTPVVVNDRAYTIRVRFPEDTRAIARPDPQHHDHQQLHRQDGDAGLAGRVSGRSRADGNSSARICSGDVAVTGRFEGVSLGKGMEAGAAGRGAICTCRRRFAWSTAALTRSSRNRSSDLLVVLALAVVLVFTVLLFEFRTFAAPTAILASALLSTSGVFLALLVTGTTFNISSFMGLIMVIGIVAKNGILLLDADQRFRAEGSSARDAMIQAGERRLRPILMTALATIAGMIPLSLAIGAGSQMLQPLAIAVIGGMLASMVLSLIVTPAVHYYLSGRPEERA